MPKLSVLIPSRNEPYLVRTIEDCFTKAKSDTEVVAVLEGYWPDNWKDVTAKYPNLHTVHHGEPKGLRASINDAAASAISRGVKYLFKLDAHCMLDEGYDVKLLADIEPNWIVVPRRKRLNPETWSLTDTQKLDIDYHYLSFPDDPKDFGGPGLNGKVWEARAKERRDKPEFDVDSEMSSQGSAWCTSVENFIALELMDDKNYGPFWNEMQECGLKAWLSGGQLMVNKKTWYAHWHKGKAGRGYRLNEDWLKQGASFTKKWLFNEAWAKQTLPFKTLIERFWPVPSWPENWEELVYGSNKSVVAVATLGQRTDALLEAHGKKMAAINSDLGGLTIHHAYYGIGDTPDGWIDVTNHIQSLVNDNTLDIGISNAVLVPGENPWRGQKKRLKVVYSYDGGERVEVTRDERDALIIGQMQPRVDVKIGADFTPAIQGIETMQKVLGTMSATAINDLLIRRFKIPDRRLRGPMPIEIPTFHRNDLAKLFAELGFTRGAEVGVAEGHYSEILVKANPNLELLCVDPWAAYDGNAQQKTKAKHEYAYNETARRLAGSKAVMISATSMDVVRDVPDNSLDFVYLDGNHSYPYIMSDLIFWSQKVRSGGVISGDDVYRLDEERWGAGPMEAVYDYTRAMRINPWWLIAAPRSVDFFFVKP